MSVKVNYKGAEIASADTDITKVLKTSGKYCEGDITIVNTQDGGGSLLTISTPQFINIGKAVFPDNFTDLKLTVTNTFINSLATFLAYSSFVKIELNMAGTYTGSASGAFRESTNLEEVRISGAEFAGDASYMFYNCTKLKTVTGLNSPGTGNANWANAFYADRVLENVEFVSNSIKNTISFELSPLLTSASLVSIGNGLYLYGSGTWTLRLASQSKTKLSTILGTVTDGVFVESAGGTVTLQNFITNTKGWTIA